MTRKMRSDKPKPRARQQGEEAYVPFPQYLAWGPVSGVAWSDVALASMLLDGFGKFEATGLIRSAYFHQRSEDEITARAALVRLLRSDKALDRWLRNRLADLFDPASQCERELEFRFRSGGRRADRRAGQQVAWHVVERMQQGEKVEAAIASAMKRFGLERSAVYNATRRFRGLIERMLSERH